MKLYEWDFAPNCRRVRMFLLLRKGSKSSVRNASPPISSSRTTIATGMHTTWCPCWSWNDGTQIGEALSIWHYFETLHPDPPLMGATPVEKAMISAWERRAYDEGMVVNGGGNMYRGGGAKMYHGLGGSLSA